MNHKVFNAEYISLE